MEAHSCNTEQLFSEKYSQYSTMLYRLSMIYLGNAYDAEEAVQEAFIRLLYKAPVFADMEHEKRWLLRVQINICKDMLKSGWRTKTVRLEETGSYQMEPDSLYIMEQLVALPQKYKSVIYLHYYEGYRLQEIAKLLGIGLSAVKMRIKRGKELLRMELEVEADE
ncbi:MAG: RNA polymerase sigma factor [Clostridiales bacterium]|jgi:RNA polymerase sigma factor (sigma-70 family)|nr:RNA polymerase sigma factor [Clostridiales bacterium]